LLHPWGPAFGVKLSYNQFYVTFQEPRRPARLRSSIKLDVMSRRAVPHFEFCKKMVSARAADNGTNEDEWLPRAASLLKHDKPHPVRTVFHNAAAYDLRMQRAVRAAFMACSERR
jgi:hypothetical protein